MLSILYQTLASIGYSHPLHPAVTHVPVGLITGAFLFALAAAVRNQPSLAETARHCLQLALLFLPAAALLGIMDWQHFYAGAWLQPIVMKIILAAVLIVLLVISLMPSGKKSPLALYGLCLLVVVGIGFFGGELVYGTGDKAGAGADERVARGASIFEQKCALCHYTDRHEKRIGPGLKDLFHKGRMPSSGRPVSAEAIASLLKAPYDSMPVFADIEGEELEALIEYLKTL